MKKDKTIKKNDQLRNELGQFIKKEDEPIQIQQKMEGNIEFPMPSPVLTWQEICILMMKDRRKNYDDFKSSLDKEK